MNKKKRITVMVPQEKTMDIEVLKKERFKEKSNSEMLRYLMKEGLYASGRQKIQPDNLKSDT